MKKNGIILIFFLTLISCSNSDSDSTTPVSKYDGKWKLVKMTNSMNDVIVTGENLEWQENYDFRKDNNFTKTRIREGITTKISGTFSVEKKDVTYFKLTYINTSPIIGSCEEQKKEVLFITNEGLLKNTWDYCDGPGLIYEKAE